MCDIINKNISFDQLLKGTMKIIYGQDYDSSDKYSIEEYGQRMVGKTFQDIIDMDQDMFILREDSALVYGEKHENEDRKGGLGQIVEECFFHYTPNSDPTPDFEDAGVELKTTPYKVNKNGTLSAKERLVLNMINYFNVVDDDVFEDSHFWYKNRLLLLVFYLWDPMASSRLSYQINYVRLFTPSIEDLLIIKSDYHKIIAKIKEGKAHELSESDTLYLSACTKSSDSTITRTQPYNSVPAKPRAFAYKNSYMTYVLNNYIIGKKPLYDSIVKSDDIDDFESYVIQNIDKYKGMSFTALSKLFDIDTSKKHKNLGSILTFRMLGIKSNNAEEFVKANIVIKTIRTERNGKIVENMSFPSFRFTDLIKEEWEHSGLRTMFSSTKYLFVIFSKNNKNEYVLSRAMFWNMPPSILETKVKEVWMNTVKVLKNVPEKIYDSDKRKYIGIFPKQSENEICHVRPHGKDSNDTYTLPDGREYPKQCFWLNNSYIESIIKQS